MRRAHAHKVTDDARLPLRGRAFWPSLVFALACWLVASPASAQVCVANPGKDGPNGALSGIVNTFYPGSASVSAGALSITLGASNASGAATPIAVGDLLLVIQMQDGTFNSTNGAAYGDGSTGRGSTGVGGAGLYEYVAALSAVGLGGGSVSIRGTGTGGGLVNAYTNAAANSTVGGGAQGVHRFQVIRVPQYSSATLSGTLTAPAWDGTSGGVVAFDVAGNLSLGGGVINVTGLGFRGGGGRALAGGRVSGQVRPTNSDFAYFTSSPVTSTTGAHGSKGEGILGTPRYVFNPQTSSSTNSARPPRATRTARTRAALRATPAAAAQTATARTSTRTTRAAAALSRRRAARRPQSQAARTASQPRSPTPTTRPTARRVKPSPSRRRKRPASAPARSGSPS